jgi:hypothetical protein
MERRAEHITTGLRELGATVERECAPLERMWQDFARVVRADWRR